jgi:hypothetical protein
MREEEYVSGEILWFVAGRLDEFSADDFIGHVPGRTCHILHGTDGLR